MFILVLFGYKQHRIFTIDCLSASLIDAVLDHATKDMLKLLAEKETQHQAEVTLIERTHLAKLEKKLEDIKAKQKEKEELEGVQPESQESARPKEDKKKDKKKDKNQASQEELDPMEAQRQELLKEHEALTTNLEKYKEKLAKCEESKKKLSNLGEATVELVDSAGERKYVKTKAEQMANTYLADKNTYSLALVKSVPEQEEDEVEMLSLDGYALRTLEEDVVAKEQEALVQAAQKDKKKGKKTK